MRPTDHTVTNQWLTQHGLTDVEPTPLLATRLAVRRQARFVDSLLLAAFILAASCTHVVGRFPDVTTSWLPFAVLAGLVAGLLAGQWLVGSWVRRADQRAGANLPRRVAHPVELGWAAVLGRPLAAFTVVNFAAPILLALSVLPLGDAALRYGATIVLIGLVGAVASTVLQLRQVLASPAVAEDEPSLTADVIMRVEDTRALVTPSLAWSLPPILLVGESLGWWNAVSLALVATGAVAFCLIQLRGAGAVTTARRALATR